MEEGNTDEKLEEVLERLERIERVQEENREKIRGLYHSMQWTRAFRIIYIVLILSVAFGVYYYIQPYIGSLVEAYSGVQNSFDFLKNFSPR